MTLKKLSSGQGYEVGDILRISSEVYEVRVSRVTDQRVSLEWPWRDIDPESQSIWEGSIGFPRDPDHYGWRYIPWKMEPGGDDLTEGDRCLIAIPSTEVRVLAIVSYDPPEPYGWLPRPDWALGVCPVEFENNDDEDAGFMLYLNGNEPIDIEVVSRLAGTILPLGSAFLDNSDVRGDSP